MRRIVVTGANKGIGLAIARGILGDHGDTFALIGSRDPERGQAALDSLIREQPSWADRSMLLPIDVSRDDSVQRAARTVADRFTTREPPLYAVVNNAGIGGRSLTGVLEVNARGVRRVCEAFLPLIDPSIGRIVTVSSASGPNFVAKCSAERKRFFLDPNTDADALERLMQECIAMEANAQAFEQAGLGSGEACGLSKAVVNTYTQHLALEHSNLRINACTPGFIETDMTRPYAESQGKAPADLGMKSPAEGARSTLFLLFGEPEGNGRYYGSDSKRSPLDRYRSPGTPPYTGD
jgi:carbonyl reductase 1